MLLEIITCQGSLFLKNWFDLKSLGSFDCANTNYEMRSVWLQTLKNHELFCDELRTALNHTKCFNTEQLFNKWVISREIFTDFINIENEFSHTT
jgi:hypothetical protein